MTILLYQQAVDLSPFLFFPLSPCRPQLLRTFSPFEPPFPQLGPPKPVPFFNPKCRCGGNCSSLFRNPRPPRNSPLAPSCISAHRPADINIFENMRKLLQSHSSPSAFLSSSSSISYPSRLPFPGCCVYLRNGRPNSSPLPAGGDDDVALRDNRRVVLLLSPCASPLQPPPLALSSKEVRGLASRKQSFPYQRMHNGSDAPPSAHPFPLLFSPATDSNLPGRPPLLSS